MERLISLVPSASEPNKVGVPEKEGSAVMIQTVDDHVVRVPVYLKAYRTTCRHYVVLSQPTGSKLQRDVGCINLRMYRCSMPDPDEDSTPNTPHCVIQLVPHAYEGHALTLELSNQEERQSWWEVLQNSESSEPGAPANSPQGRRRRHPMLMSCHSEGYLKNIPTCDVQQQQAQARSFPVSPQISPLASPFASNLRRSQLQRSSSGPGGFLPWGSQGSLRSHSVGSDSEGEGHESNACDDPGNLSPAGHRSPSGPLAECAFNFSPRLSPSPMLRRPTLPSVSEDANSGMNGDSFDDLFHEMSTADSKHSDETVLKSM